MPRRPLFDTIELTDGQRLALHQAIVAAFGDHDPYHAAVVKVHTGLNDIAARSLAGTLRRALSNHQTARREKRRLTKALRDLLEAALGKDLVHRAIGATTTLHRTPLVFSERGLSQTEALRGHQALSEKGEFHGCLDLAQRMARRSEGSREYFEASIWHAKASTDLRRLGELHASLQSLDNAMMDLEALPIATQNRDDVRMTRLKIAFGLTLNGKTMLLGEFAEGLREHSEHERVAKELVVSKNKQISEMAKLYVGHVRRQKAECLRYLGRYAEALELARQCLRGYKKYDVQPRLWSRGYIADNLRLLGKTTEAMKGIAELIEEALFRNLSDQTITFEWRRVTLELLVGNSRVTESVGALAQAAKEGRHSRWAIFYANLVAATGSHNDVERAELHLTRAANSAALTSDNFRLEYAYLRLAEGEFYRSQGMTPLAVAAFRRAYETFSKMGVAWGVVRSAIGLRILGQSVSVQKLESKLEGLDREIWEEARSLKEFQPGRLVFNLP